jgi:hypothetical protein
MCAGCGTFWGGTAQLEQAHNPGQRPEPPPVTLPAATCCIDIGSSRSVALPDNTEIVLGRQSDWEQIAELISSQSEEATLGVSRRHAALTVLGDKARIIDLGSTNGTWVAGKDVSASPVVRSLPTSFVLGLPYMGLVVTVRPILRGEPVSEWTGVRRV